MSDMIVDPVPGVFTFIDADGKGLKDIAMQLNEEWGMYMVRRIGDDAQLKGLEKTFEEVKKGGVDRGTMIAVESLNMGTLNGQYPSNSYTLKRSRTNQTIALEEIGSRIIDMLKKAYLFLLETAKKGFAHMSAFVAATKQKMKRETGQQRKAAAENADLFKGAHFLSPEEIKKNAQLSAQAEAINENYSELLNVLLNKASFRNAFQNLVEDSPAISKQILVNVEKMTKALSLVNEKRFGDALMIVSEIKTVEPPTTFNSFIQYLGSSRNESLSETLMDANDLIRSLGDDKENIDPYNLADLTNKLKTAVNIIGGQKPFFIFDDSALETSILKAVREVDAAEKAVRNYTITNDEIRSDVNRELKSKMAEINKSNQFLIFVISHAEHFFNLIATFSKNATYFLESCKVK